MIVTTAQLYKPAYGNYAVGAYNVNNMEQLLGLFSGNVRSKAPFIIQLSKGARKYADKRMLEAMVRTAEGIFPEAIFAVHHDGHPRDELLDLFDHFKVKALLAFEFVGAMARADGRRQ